jgi:ribonucleoside-diphosphate reductase alpha chain
MSRTRLFFLNAGLTLLCVLTLYPVLWVVKMALSPTQALENLAWQEPQRDVKAIAAERRAEAKAKGYEGEMCGECANFTLVRNGTCMKCDTCGSTTGCS